ncbi:sugar transferase [Corynebacterium crudilactis]|uniref:UDP-galactose phosphate transferase n=1 Tax=Corynebacterium crudilactis TaxID=1652495 RepID=A0A172QQZ6_9CORY|nr:sugar transferase [Corynebacterium crudilactis]ANE03080.1 UDP-galactose phosphate transferase [Corynebacterium crudilactis]
MVARNRVYDFGKRLIDIFVSSIAFVITAPLQALIFLIVRFTLGRPVFFRQRRPGKNGVIFEMIKFRTMREATNNLTTDAERLTKIGKILRASSLDELPTLWNVLKGDMSLVGPRPLLESYLEKYSDEQARRHEVKPGVTGLAQVRGRNSITWDERLVLDVEYVDRRSLKLDFKILIETIKVIIKKDGITHQDHATMPLFKE